MKYNLFNKSKSHAQEHDYLHVSYLIINIRQTNCEKLIQLISVDKIGES